MKHGNFKHGEGPDASRGRLATPEYQAWINIKSRCLKRKHWGYPNYGGRGIKICKRWSKFENFLADMGRRPGLGYSIDRRDNDGHYTPDNCRWATALQQTANRRAATMTAVGAILIRGLRARGAAYEVLASAFGVSRKEIGRIVRCERWGDALMVLVE